MPVILPDDVIGTLAADPRISKIELAGSRARGAATPLSDWDFAVTTPRFDEVRDALAETVRPLRPVVNQWDRLSGDDIVAGELHKLHEHLLGPMGVAGAPSTLGDAVTAYRSARATCERRLGSHVSRNAENAVLPALRP